MTKRRKLPETMADRPCGKTGERLMWIAVPITTFLDDRTHLQEAKRLCGIMRRHTQGLMPVPLCRFIPPMLVKKPKVEKPRRFLGYGVFYSSMWDHKYWAFNPICGIWPTAKEASEVFSRRTTHCLHRETRRIYTTTKLNVGAYDRKDRGARWIKPTKAMVKS